MSLCLLQLQPVVYFLAFPHGWQNATFTQGFPSQAVFSGGCETAGWVQEPKADFSRFKEASILLLSATTDASKTLHQWCFSLQNQKRRRRSRIFLMVEGNWDLYLCRYENPMHSLNSWCPEWLLGRLQYSLGWRAAVQGGFWWDISGKLGGW